MRTTIDIDQDVLDRARSVAAKMDTTLRLVVNEALRAGLESIEETTERRLYRTEPRDLGLHGRVSLDNISELLAHSEGDDRR